MGVFSTASHRSVGASETKPGAFDVTDGTGEILEVIETKSITNFNEGLRKLAAQQAEARDKETKNEQPEIL